METRTRNGFVVINNVPYRRSKFVKTDTSVKDWALFALIMLSMAFMVVLAIGTAALIGMAIIDVVRRWL